MTPIRLATNREKLLMVGVTMGFLLLNLLRLW